MMNHVQEIITIEEEEAMLLADNILREDVPRIDTCEVEDREVFLDECRWAIMQLVRKTALLAAFREKVEEDLATLCTRARVNISNPSYVLSVQEWVLQNLDVQNLTEIHPSLKDVMKVTLQACNKIIRSLHVKLPPEPTTDEAS